MIIIDPTHHDDGQKIAFEYRNDVGGTLPILKSLAKQMQIGSDPPPFDVQIDPIVQPASFWRFAEQNNYEIKILSFEVSPPNMLGGAEDFKNEIRALRDTVRVNRLKTTLTSDTTLDVTQENIREVIDYTERGAGRVKARSVSGQSYNSNAHTAYEVVDADEGSDDFWSKFVSWLGERF